MTELFRRDDDGNIIDPPTIPEHERRIAEAQARGDQALVDQYSDDYADARTELVERMERDADADDTDTAPEPAPPDPDPDAGADDGAATQTGNPPTAETSPDNPDAGPTRGV